MAANTGPDINTYAIPEVALGDTFNTWRDVTNTGVYKLNKIRVYDGVSSSSIDITVAAGGTLAAAIADNVNKGVTFMQPVTFQSGVTFNGDVTFNASTFTVNANVVTIDDYSLILGNTAAGSSDTKINAAGGGGLLIDRGGSGNTAEWLWKTTNVHGLTGVWQANAHIGISGATFGIYPNAGGILPVHGSGIRLDGGSTSDHGLLVELTSTGVAGTTSNRSVQFERYSPAGATVFMEVLSGTTYGSRPFVNISDGANRKTITQSSHSFVFGTPVRFNKLTSAYAKAQASDADSAEVVGVVSKVIDANTFEITFIGEIFGDFSPVNAAGSGLVAGTVYYLTPDSEGKLTPVQPTSPGTVHKAVLIATGTQSAVVMPFTGGVLQSPIQIANSSSVATRIVQYNTFKVGDVVRFKAYPSGVTLSYKPTVGATVEANYSDGIYVKAEADTPEEAEIAGMVIALGATNGINDSFDVLMDGFFNVGSWSSPYSTLQPGTVYFLNTGCAGTTGSFESGVASLTITPPSTEGTVRKPMLMATSALSGYLFSYRGDVRGAATGISYANLANFLVSDIQDGISGDLKIGVYDGSSTGREAIKIAAGTGKFATSVGVTGYVGVGGGWTSLASGTGNRILAPLDVRGEIRVGLTVGSTPQGRDLIVSRYSTDDIASNGTTAAALNVIGTRWSSSSLAIGHAVRSAVSSDGWISSLPSSTSSPRSALVVGVSGSDPSLVWKTAASSAVALGGAVSLTDAFSIVGSTATMNSVLVSTGASNRIIANLSGPQYTQTTSRISSRGWGNAFEWGDLNGGGYGCVLGSQNTNGAPFVGFYCESGTGTNTYRTRGFTGWVMKGNNGGVDDGITPHSLVFATIDNPNADNQTPTERMRITADGEVRVGTSTTSSSNAKTLTTKDYVTSIKSPQYVIVGSTKNLSANYNSTGNSFVANGVYFDLTVAAGWYAVVMPFISSGTFVSHSPSYYTGPVTQQFSGYQSAIPRGWDYTVLFFKNS